jgi:hypothetical protein
MALAHLSLLGLGLILSLALVCNAQAKALLAPRAGPGYTEVQLHECAILAAHNAYSQEVICEAAVSRSQVPGKHAKHEPRSIVAERVIEFAIVLEDSCLDRYAPTDAEAGRAAGEIDLSARSGWMRAEELGCDVEGSGVCHESCLSVVCSLFCGDSAGAVSDGEFTGRGPWSARLPSKATRHSSRQPKWRPSIQRVFFRAREAPRVCLVRWIAIVAADRFVTQKSMFLA